MFLYFTWYWKKIILFTAPNILFFFLKTITEKMCHSRIRTKFVNNNTPFKVFSWSLRKTNKVVCSQVGRLLTLYTILHLVENYFYNIYIKIIYKTMSHIHVFLFAGSCRNMSLQWWGPQWNRIVHKAEREPVQTRLHFYWGPQAQKDQRCLLLWNPAQFTVV